MVHFRDRLEQAELAHVTEVRAGAPWAGMVVDAGTRD